MYILWQLYRGNDDDPLGFQGVFVFETMTKCLEIRSCFPEVDHSRNPLCF